MLEKMVEAVESVASDSKFRAGVDDIANAERYYKAFIEQYEPVSMYSDETDNSADSSWKRQVGGDDFYEAYELPSDVLQQEQQPEVGDLREPYNTFMQNGVFESVDEMCNALELNECDVYYMPDDFEEDFEVEWGSSEKTLEVESTRENDIEDRNEECQDNELTPEEINEKQKEAIKDAWERIRNGEELTKDELGNLGEMMMDQYYISQGYEPLNMNRVTGLDDKKIGFKTGIDGVYEKNNPDGTNSYVIADAKYNTAQLKMTKAGMQMSDNWIDKNLDKSVGKEKADEIRDAVEDNPDLVSHEVYHINPNVDEKGNIHTDVQKVDSEGNRVGNKTIVECFDEARNRIDPSEID